MWLALAFAAGIAASGFAGGSVALWLSASLLTIALGLCVTLFSKSLGAAGFFALAAWFALGGLTVQFQRHNFRANDFPALIARGNLDTKEPLRWTGRLREDPAATPLGVRYTIDLQSVEQAGRALPVRGGLRLAYYRGDSEETPPPLRAGDIVEALCRARIPRNYLDPGAFDERAYLARQGIDLLGELRSTSLIQIAAPSIPTLAERLARLRGDLLTRLDALFGGKPERVAVLRAMLLGDRNFVNSDIAETFQKTASFHVLVLAGLHVAALAFFIFWLGRVMHLPPAIVTLLTLTALAAYLGVVQDRPPILRAALMTGIFLCARLFFRRVALLNTVALAALTLLVADPSDLFDSSFQLSFLAAGVIAGLAIPWIDRTSTPYRRALEHLSDVTRDRSHSPRATQFRLDLRTTARVIAQKAPKRLAPHAESLLLQPVRLGLRIWEIFVLSFCIQLGMAPLLALYFHRVSISGPVTNVLAVPLTGVIVPLGFLALGASYASIIVASLLARLESVLVALLLMTVKWFGALPRVSWRIPSPPSWLLVVYLLALVCLAAIAWSAVQSRAHSLSHALHPITTFIERVGIFVLLFLAVLVSVHPFPPHLQKSKLEATVLDVGQGDSIFVAFPDGRTMLVDGGGVGGAARIHGYQVGFDIGEQVVSPYLWSRGIKKLDVVVLTHAHHDHIDGLRAVLNNFRVGQLWVGRDENSPAYRALLAEARAHRIAIVHVTQGRNFNWDGTTGQIVWPSASYAAEEAAEPANNDSVVLRIGDGAIHFLLAGDAERQVEDTLTEENQPLQSDFLKVPHHGSKTSSTANFLDAVQPRVAAVSVGEDNMYGHPNAATLQRYAAKNIPVFRTDMNGAITVLTDGHTLFVRPFASGGVQPTEVKQF